jgi:hypothetical protein
MLTYRIRFLEMQWLIKNDQYFRLDFFLPGEQLHGGSQLKFPCMTCMTDLGFQVILAAGQGESTEVVFFPC